MQSVISTWKNPQFPSITLAIGLFGTISCSLFSAYFPSIPVLIVSVGLIFITFFFGRFLLCGIALGIIAIGLNAPIPYSENFSNCQFIAQIIRPNYSGSSINQEIRLLTDNITCDSKIFPAQVIQYWDNSKKISNNVGKRLMISADLLPVHSRLNPYSFDYERYLLSEGVRLSAKKLSITDSYNESSLLLQAKNHVANTLFKQLSPANAGIILALLTGNRSALSSGQKATMQATGTSHLLAISGLHLALIGGMTWVLFQWAWALSWKLSDRLSPRHAGAIATLCVITGYAALTGFDIPVKRAWIMFSLMILSWLLRRGLSNSSLLLAACAVLFISPYAVVSVGFYFSFIATFIVLWAARLPYSPLMNVFIMQALINVTLFPIIWLTFGIVSPVAFFVNLLVIPWLGLWVLPWAVLASLISFISNTLATPIWTLLDLATSMLWQTITFAEQLNWTLTPNFRPSLIAVILMLSTIIIALLMRIKWLFLAAFLALVPITPAPKPALVVADKGYTSAIIHNGRNAILINPGRRYRHINHAKMWLRYLQQHKLTLEAIVLENDKLTKISATKWLLNSFPEAKIITATAIDLPYPSQYCQSAQWDNLILNSQQIGNQCQMSIQWFTHHITLFTDGKNTISSRAVLNWEEKNYDTSKLGTVKITKTNEQFSIDYPRKHKRLWRKYE